MYISGSVYSWSDLGVVDAAQKLERSGVDYLHIDCLDDMSCFDDIREIKAATSTPVDLHLIADNPGAYYEGIRDTGIEVCCFQYENLKEELDVPDWLKCRLGLAITVDTPVSVFAPYAERFSFLLLMTTTPGKSGGTFNHKVFQRIREFQKLFPSKSIHVDGGVNDEVSFALKSHGVRLAVVGSYLMKSNDIVKNTLLIRGHKSETSDFFVRDFMLYPEEFPVLDQEGLSVLGILQEMSSRRFGFAAIVDKSWQLIGIVTDGDVRRAWQKSLENNVTTSLEGLINQAPQIVRDTDTVADMLEKASGLNHSHLYLPVVEDGGKLCGAVTLRDLVDGET